MEYDSGALIDIRQASGRFLWCSKYVVAATYEGFLEGTLSASWNEIMLDHVRREATRYFGQWSVHILQPAREPGEIEYPPVRITAFFTPLPMDNQMHLSSLVVIWFQRQPLRVPDEAGRATIEALDWERLAIDYET